MSLPAENQIKTADELPFWRRKAMKDMTPAEWESLCDGCGRCCLNKLQEEGSDRTYYTDVGCKLLDGRPAAAPTTPTAPKVKDCVTLTTRNINRISWLPPTCGYKLVAAGRIVLVASARLRRPGDGASGRGIGAGQGGAERGRCRGQGFWRINIVSWPLKWPKGAKGR